MSVDICFIYLGASILVAYILMSEISSSCIDPFVIIYCLSLSFVTDFVLFIYLFIYLYIFWLCWVFISMRGLSLVAVSGGHSSSRCLGLSLSRPLLLWSTSSRHAGSVAVVHGPSCSVACGIFQTRARTRVPCIGRQILNHCATREAPRLCFKV